MGNRRILLAAQLLAIGALLGPLVACTSSGAPQARASSASPTGPTAASLTPSDAHALVEELTADRSAFGMRVNGAYAKKDGTVVLLVDEVTPAGKQAVADHYGSTVVVKAAPPGSDA